MFLGSDTVTPPTNDDTCREGLNSHSERRRILPLLFPFRLKFRMRWKDIPPLLTLSGADD